MQANERDRVEQEGGGDARQRRGADEPAARFKLGQHGVKADAGKRRERRHHENEMPHAR